MAESILQKKLDARLLTKGLTPDETVEQHTILLAAIAASGQTLDGSMPVGYTPDKNPNRILEFGREVTQPDPKPERLAVDSAKSQMIRKALLRHGRTG